VGAMPLQGDAVFHAMFRVKFFRKQPRIGGYLAVPVASSLVGAPVGSLHAVLAADTLVPGANGQQFSERDQEFVAAVSKVGTGRRMPRRGGGEGRAQQRCGESHCSSSKAGQQPKVSHPPHPPLSATQALGSALDTSAAALRQEAANKSAGQEAVAALRAKIAALRAAAAGPAATEGGPACQACSSHECAHPIATALHATAAHHCHLCRRCTQHAARCWGFGCDFGHPPWPVCRPHDLLQAGVSPSAPPPRPHPCNMPCRRVRRAGSRG
jgi:hypothetical protein